MTDDVTHATDTDGRCWLSGPGFSGLPCSLPSHATTPERGRDGLREAIEALAEEWMRPPERVWRAACGVRLYALLAEHPATGDEGYTTADAWEDNYRGMAARWAECDSERLALKEKLADAEMRLRLLASEPDPATGDEERGCRECGPGCLGHTTPPASDVDSDNAAAGGAEGLAEVERVALEDWLIDNRWPDAYDLSHAVLTSDWLAAHVARAKAEALREAARDARSSPSTRVGDLHPGEVWAAWLDGRADRIEGTR